MLRIVAAALLGSLAPAVGVFAGDLNPPAGPVVETMKTLDEVEPRIPIHQEDVPFTVTIPGSYYLAENLVFPAAASGVVITIAADDVTLDLNGFTIDGQDVGGDAEFVLGIGVSSEDVLIRNGRIVGTGVCINAQSTLRVFIDSVVANPIDGGTGIQASSNGVVSDCHIDGGAIGIDTTVASGFVLRDCVVRGVSVACYDFRFNAGGHIEGCLASGGDYGYRLGSSAGNLVFLDCASSGSSIGFSDLSGLNNQFYRNLALRNNVAYQNVANVSATPGTAGAWDNIEQ